MHGVLVVDDDPAIVEVVSEALSMEDIPHRTAANGKEALAAVEAERPDVILLDINMPVMDGVAFCRALDEGPGRDHSAIVVMTAYNQAPRYRVACAADDVLPKPFSLDVLYTVVERYLARP